MSGPNVTSPWRVRQALALHLLAKVYLTRGWSSASQSTDFQNAYEIATELIQDSGQTGVTLMPRYADIHKPGNEDNQEILYNVQMTDDPIYGVPQADANINHLSHVFVGGY